MPGTVQIAVSDARYNYPDFPNVRFLLYSMVSGAGSILYGSKVGWNLRRHIEVPVGPLSKDLGVTTAREIHLEIQRRHMLSAQWGQKQEKRPPI